MTDNVRMAEDMRWARCPECHENTAQTSREPEADGVESEWVCGQCHSRMVIMPPRPRDRVSA